MDQDNVLYAAIREYLNHLYLTQGIRSEDIKDPQLKKLVDLTKEQRDDNQPDN